MFALCVFGLSVLNIFPKPPLLPSCPPHNSTSINVNYGPL